MAAKSELPVSAKDLIRFTPSAYESDPEKPVYLMAVPSLVTKPRWERDRTACGAQMVSAHRMTEFLRDAAGTMLTGEARIEALRDLDVTDELRERQGANGAKLSDDEQKELVRLMVRIAELGEWAQRVWPPYAELAAQQEYWWTMSQVLAARHFIRGWENVTERCGACGGSGKTEERSEPREGEAAPQGAPCAQCEGSAKVAVAFAAKDGLVREDVLERLPRGDVFACGLEAMSLMRVDSERRKN